jgi:hypothetical protein
MSYEPNNLLSPAFTIQVKRPGKPDLVESLNVIPVR